MVGSSKVSGQGATLGKIFVVELLEKAWQTTGQLHFPGP